MMTHKIQSRMLACAAIAAAVTLGVIVAHAAPVQPKNARTYAPVVSPRIPDKMTFCGETIDLTRPDVFEKFDRELTSLIYGHGNTLLTLKRANKVFPTIIPILREEGIPDDVAYLACVESYLNPRAYSPAKAAGIWQFIPSAAKEYGLEVSDDVDERYNLEKSTRAAARYLKQAYRKYGNWPAAMASYNGGQGRITGELSRQNVGSFFDLYLADETTRYVYRIMAMKAVMDDPKVFGYELHPENFYYPTECSVVEVSGPVDSWVDWASEHGITYAMLRDENPWIRAKSMANKANKTYSVRVPNKDKFSRKSTSHRLFNHKWVL